MIEGLFDVAIDTPKYHRRGTLSLRSSGEDIEARLNVAEIDELVFNGTCASKEFDFEGSADLPGIGQTSYKAHGSVWGNSISISCEIDKGKVEIFGTRLSSEAGKPVSSHEYMMKASRGEFDEDSTMYSGLYADGG